MLRKHKGQWALMSKSSPGKVLKYFGTSKPSSAAVAKEEARVNWFKHGGGSGALTKHTK